MTDTAAPQPSMPQGGVTHLPLFYVKQRIALTVNRYEIRAAKADGSMGDVIAIAQQKRLALKEQVTFYADEARTTPVFSFKARQVFDLAAVYDVWDAAGTPIGWFQKDFGKSLIRSSFHLVGYGVDALGQERNEAIAIARRFIDLPFLFHFDFHDTQTMRPVMSSQKRFALRDSYVITVPDERLDFRLAAAMAVGLDTLMQR
jgi:uncharacterized protein YxjI